MIEMVVKEEVLAPDTLRALQYVADTKGKGFEGDINRVVEWLLTTSKRHEPFLRFTLDLYAESERKRLSRGLTRTEAAPE